MNDSNATQWNIAEYEYIMAVLLRLTEGTELQQSVREAVTESVSFFQADQNRVFSLSEKLVDSENPMVREHIKFMEVMTGYLGAGFFLAIEAVAVFNLIP